MTPTARRILVVEDSPTQAQALEALLESAGYTVSLARSGELALAMLETERVDIILSDVVMPGMSGYDLSRAVKARPDLTEIPFILVTSLSDPLDIIRGLECGADNYVTKPYDADQLLRRIATVFATAELRRDGPKVGPVDITFLGTHFVITSEKERILDLLLSSFEELVRTNAALRVAESEQERLYGLELAARKEAEGARKIAEEANRGKSEFLAMMSHDLRTPLNAIGGYADLLALGVRGPVNAAQSADLARIKHNQEHLSALVNDVLNFARVERGDISLKLATTPLSKTLKPLSAMIGPQTRKRSQTYRFLPCDDDLFVVADTDRLEQIVVNLLGNAVKFTPEGGSITMSCAADGGMARIDVRDTGIGIDQAKLESIFEPFTQLDQEAGQREGVGLGLAISRKLSRLMGGDLSATSVAGEGSVFSVFVPLAEPKP